MNLVLDASVAIASISVDEDSAYAASAIGACQEDSIFVPLIWRLEIANTLVLFERKGRLSNALDSYERFVRRFHVRIIGDFRIEREVQLARKHQLTVYDAAYLAVAIAERMPLATLDAKLRRAAIDEDVYFAPSP